VPVKCKLRLKHWCGLFGFITRFPMMSWAKHFFAKLRVFPANNTCLNHALTVIWCARFLPVACSCAVIVLCSATVACCWQWLASSLPSPPGSTPGLSFSSWTYCWSPILLLLGLILSFSWSPWFSWMFLCDEVQELVLFLMWCARTVVFLRWCSAGHVSAVSPGNTHQVGCLLC
jgi:hypothetical protein